MFSKAKITRFNEVGGCAPPPGSYDPKFEEKLVGGVLSKTQRFPELLADEALGVDAIISRSTEHLPKKTPLKTPKYIKPLPPLPRSSVKKKIITTSLQDLSKVLHNEGDAMKLKEEINELKAKLEKSQVFCKRVATWVSSIEDSSVEALHLIVDEWHQFSDMSNLQNPDEQQKDLENALNQIVELRAVIAENQALVSSLRSEVLSSADTLGSLSEGNNNLQNLVSELEKSKQQLQQQLLLKCDLMEEVLAADDTLRKELMLTKSYGKTLEESFNEQCQEVRRLEMQVAALEELLEKKADLESINANLEAELKQAKEEGSVLRMNLASTESTLEIVKEERGNLLKHLHDADEGIADIERQLCLKNKEFGAKIDNVSAKAHFLETQTATLQNQLKLTIEERDNLKTHLSEYQEKVASLQQQQEETLSTLSEEMTLAQQSEHCLQKLVAEKMQLLKDEAKLKEDVTQVRQELLDSRKELHQALHREKQLQHSVIEANRETLLVRDRIIALEERLEVNFTETEESKRILQSFSEKAVEFNEQKENLLQHLNEKNGELAKMTEKYENEIRAKEKLTRKLSGTKNLQKNLQDKLSTAESDLLLLNEKLLQSQEKEAKSSMVSSELKKQVSKLEEKVLLVSKEKDKSIQELSKVNEVLRREIEEVQTSLESIQFYREQIQTEVSKAVDHNLELQQEKEFLQAQLKKGGEDLGVVQEELRGAKEHLQEHLTESNKNIDALKEQLHEAQTEVLNLKRESIEANESIFELCHKLLDLEKMLNDTKAASAETLRKIAISLEMSGEVSMEAIDRRLASLNKYVEELEDEFAESVLLKLKVEDELEEERIKATGLSDQVFDLCQERQDVQMCLEAVSRKLVAVEAEKQSLEDEFAKAEKEWDVRELKLVTDIKLLGEEAKEAEDKQIEFEAQIQQMQDEIQLLKESCKWEEEKQLKTEQELSELMAEKERCIERCVRLEKLLAETKKREDEARTTVESCQEKMEAMSSVVQDVKREVQQFSEVLKQQDEDMSALEELLKEKEDQLEKVSTEKDEQVRLLEGRLLDQEEAMKRLLNEVESRVQAADEMEDLLQRKIAELGRTKENVGKLEAHSKSLLEKSILLEEKEMRAQSEMKKAQAEAVQANKALEMQIHEFSSRWSTMEDSILNLDAVEGRNKELSASDVCLRSQVSILESESERLRSTNASLRERLLELEKEEAKTSGHQNHLQKLSYMQNLKEVVFKHQKNEEDMHARLVASECKVAQLESEMQKHGISLALSKSMVVEGVSATTKKSRHGKENRSLMASLSRTAHSLLSTSSPLHKKSPLQLKNN